MERILGDQRFQSLLLYLDDIVVFSSTIEQHLERLDLVLLSGVVLPQGQVE